MQEPRREEKAAVEAQLVREVARLKAQVEAGKACFLEKYKECRRLHKQIRQLRAAAPVGEGRGRGLWCRDPAPKVQPRLGEKP